MATTAAERKLLLAGEWVETGSWIDVRSPFDGSRRSFVLATRVPELAAAVPFYGNAPAPADAAKVKVPILAHFAETDERVNSTWPPFEEALKANNVPHQAYTYPGTQHGFNNDTTPRFSEAAAKLAWSRTLEFFNKQLR